MDPITVGSDTEVEFRDGHSNFTFVAVGKPHLKNGDRTIAPSTGFITMNMVDGVWSVDFVRLRGALIGARGFPVKREAEFVYSYLGALLGDESRGHHPDYAPPQWLNDFVEGVQNRFNGKRSAA